MLSKEGVFLGLDWSQTCTIFQASLRGWPLSTLALAFPTKATLLEAAIEGRLLSIPRASPETIYKYFPDSDKSVKGHTEQQWQGVRSTEEDPNQVKREKDIHIKVWDLRETIYSNQTGRFPFKSYQSYCYVMIMVETVKRSCNNSVLMVCYTTEKFRVER